MVQSFHRRIAVISALQYNIAAVIVSALVMAVNNAWGTAFLIFVLLIVLAVLIVPVAETMKRLLQIFFGLALFFSNMSILVNYMGIIYVEGLKYNLECGIVGELFLCLLALYVFRRWDKIPEGMDLRRIKLCRLQKGCRWFLNVSLRLMVIWIILSLINGKMKTGNLVRLSFGVLLALNCLPVTVYMLPAYLLFLFLATYNTIESFAAD